MMLNWNRLAPVVAALLALGGWGNSAKASSVPIPNTPEPGWAVNGPVRAVRLANGLAIVGGDFTEATGTNGTFPRSGIAAFRMADGSVTSLRADADGPVLAIETDSSSVFVGGSFTAIGGVRRLGLAELDATTGDVLPDLDLAAGSKVRSLALSSDRLYVGGSFSKIGDVPQAYAAAVRLSDRRIDQDFAPDLSDKVRAIRVSDDGTAVVVGGSFTQASGSPHRYLARLSRGGEADATSYNIPDGWTVWSLAINEDATRIYAGSGGPGNTLFAFDSVGANATWSQRANGDIQAVAYHAGNVYFGFHDGFPTLIEARVLVADAETGRLETSFQPSFRGFWGARGLDVDDQGLLVGGEFDAVNGVQVRNVAFFDPSSRSASAPQAIPGGGTANGPTATSGKRSKVTARAVRRASAVLAKVGPNLTGERWRIVVQRALKKQGRTRWNRIGAFTTRRAGTKTVDVPKGRYRVKVPKQQGYAASFSNVVHIKR